MKLLYLLKAFLPYVFLPAAPGVLQMELSRHGYFGNGNGAVCALVLQLIFTLGIGLCLARFIGLKQKKKAFLRMSCVSKKVFFDNRWMTVEQYLAEHHNVIVSHGMTPEESQAWIAEAEDYVRREIGEPRLAVRAA